MSASPHRVKRQEMYKMRTPPWKETYRKRCMERLRGSRDKLFSKHRNLAADDRSDDDKDKFIKNLMTEEWESLQRDRADGKSLDLVDFHVETFAVGEIDDMLNLFEDIQLELRKEELRLVQEYDTYSSSLQREEQVLCSALETLYTDEVICPLCRKSALMLNKGIVFCACGLRINTEQDCLSLSNIQHQLQDGVSTHSSGCTLDPHFEVVSGFGATNLLMTCQTCDFMFVVI